MNAEPAEHADKHWSASSANSAFDVDRMSDESSSVGETDLRQVQGRAPQGRRARDLQQPETQTAAGI